jgi:hypothetical protein
MVLVIGLTKHVLRPEAAQLGFVWFAYCDNKGRALASAAYLFQEQYGLGPGKEG